MMLNLLDIQHRLKKPITDTQVNKMSHLGFSLISLSLFPGRSCEQFI